MVKKKKKEDTSTKDLDSNALISKIEKLPKKKLLSFISKQAEDLEKKNIIIQELKNDNTSLQRDYEDLMKDFKKVRAELSEARTDLDKPVVLTRTVDKDKKEVSKVIEQSDSDELLAAFIRSGAFKKWSETSPIVSRDIDDT